MLSKKMQDALNAQVNAEMWSAYLYLSMSMDASDKGFPGAAHWFRKQYDEEMEHAFKIVDYLRSQLSRVELKPIAEVPASWNGPEEMFIQTLDHEKKVSSMIHALCCLASDEKDFATAGFLQWFVSEQIEEEATASEILEALRCIAGDKAANYMFDKELGAR